jgi:AcrR family transcriptional regulator
MKNEGIKRSGALAPAPDGYATTAESRMEEAVIGAVVELALEVGYEGITMVRVAERAGIGRATLYRHYPTKEHLFALVMKARTRQYTESLHYTRFSSRKVGKRVTQLLKQTLGHAFEDRQFLAGYLGALVSGAPDNREDYFPTIPTLLRISMGMISSRQQELAARVLQYTFAYNLILWLSGKTTPDQILKELTLVAEIILADVWEDTVI